MEGVQGGSRHSYLATFQAFHARQYTSKQKAPNPSPDTPQVVGRLRVQLDRKEIGTKSMDSFHTRKGLVMLPKLDRSDIPSELLLHKSFLRSDFGRFSKIIKQGNKKSLIDKLQLILPLLNDVDIIEDDGEHYVLCTTKTGERLKLEDMGGGMIRLFDCLVALYTSRNGMVCIDEIESGLHHTILQKFWDSLRLLSVELNVQIFAATHSQECINAAIKAYKDRPTDIGIYAMYHNTDGGRIESVRYGGDELNAINDMNVDVR